MLLALTIYEQLSLIAIGATFLVMIGILCVSLKKKKVVCKENSFFYAPLFLIIICLYLLAYIYQGERNPLSILYEIIEKTIGALYMNVDDKAVKDTLQAFMLFETAYYLAHVVIAYLSLTFVIEFFIKKVINKLKNRTIADNSYIVLGFNDDALGFIKSQNKNVYVIIEDHDDKIERVLVDEKIKYYVGSYKKGLEKYLNGKLESKVISFVEDPNAQIKVLELLYDYPNHSYLHIQENVKYLFENVIPNDCTKIHYFNKYNLMCDKFANDYPLVSLMDNNEIDYDNAVIKPGVKINCYMVGFGKVNKRLFLNLVMDNQMMELVDDKYVSKPVDFHIFDKEEFDDTFLRYTVNRIYSKGKEEDKEEPENYLPIPDSVANITPYVDAIDKFAFYNRVKKTVAKENGLNVFVISLGDELKDMEIAMRLEEKLREWDVKAKSYIFVRAYNKTITSFDKSDMIIPFGFAEDVLTEDIIVNESLVEFAKARAYHYAKEKGTTKTKDEVWSDLNRVKQEDNKRSCRSILHKLGLMGLEVSQNLDGALTSDEYYQIYDNKKQIKWNETGDVIYPLVFDESLSVRNALAHQEHNRWNASLICEGYTRFPLDKLHYENGKLFKDSKDHNIHACLTTYEGLDKYFDIVAKLVSETDGCTYEEGYAFIENKKYDYQLMDTVIKELNGQGRYIKKRDK